MIFIPCGTRVPTPYGVDSCYLYSFARGLTDTQLKNLSSKAVGSMKYREGSKIDQFQGEMMQGKLRNLESGGILEPYLGKLCNISTAIQ